MNTERPRFFFLEPPNNSFRNGKCSRRLLTLRYPNVNRKLSKIVPPTKSAIVRNRINEKGDSFVRGTRSSRGGFTGIALAELVTISDDSIVDNKLKINESGSSFDFVSNFRNGTYQGYVAFS